MIKKILALILVILLVYVFLPDVDYMPGAGDWLSEPDIEIPDNDNLFFALCGFTVTADKDPHQEGKRLVGTANQVLEKFLESGAFLDKNQQPAYENHWGNPAVTATDDINILCDPRIKDCLETWLSQKDTIEKSIVDNALLLHRYKDLYQYKNYKNLLLDDIRSPLPELGNLMAIQRLHGLEIASGFLSGDYEPAMLALRNDMVFTRRLIEQADTLIVKMVALSMLKHDLYIYATLMDAAGDNENYLFEEIPLLTEQERSFERPVQAEFLMNAKLIDEISRYPQFYTREFFFSEWLPFPLFKKNHSTNMLFNTFNKILADSRMSANEYYKSRLEKNAGMEEYKPGWLAYIYNPIGSILFSISFPDFNKYIIRIHDMDGLITMVNVKYLIKAENINKADVANFLETISDKYFDPYTGQGLYWNETERSLWIQNPENDYITNKLKISFPNDNNDETEI